VYAYAAFVGRGGGNVLTARRDQVAADVAAVEPVVEDKTEAVPVAPRRVPLRRPPRGGGGGGWMNGWR
jgi:hypothetical protein